MSYSGYTTRPAWRGWFAGVGIFAVMGCGTNADYEAAVNNLKTISSLYGDYLLSHNNKGPESDKAFKEYITRKMSKETLNAIGVEVDRLDEYFLSPRDQWPLHIRYGITVTNLGKNAPLLACENKGVRGRRLGVYVNGKVEDLDENKLKSLLPPSGNTTRR
jgi:hypothetical protein